MRARIYHNLCSVFDRHKMKSVQNDHYFAWLVGPVTRFSSGYNDEASNTILSMFPIVILLFTVCYFARGKIFSLLYQGRDKNSEITGSFKTIGNTRDIVKHMEENGKNCVVFFGSQSGTAQDFAAKIAKEGYSRFGLKAMVADLEDYDYETLVNFPEDNLAIFILATYGEGDPTDNAISFYEFITEESPTFSEDLERPLRNLNYVIFGLGNSTYTHYNSVARKVNDSLQRLGARRIGQAGEGNEGTKTMEEDFLSWKEPMWSALRNERGLTEQEAVYEPEFSVVEQNMNPTLPAIFRGEINKNHLAPNPEGPYSAHNPYIAPIVESKELFTAENRNCLHLEIDIRGTNLAYETGDHLAIWPMNPEIEVNRILRVLGLSEKRDTVITIKAQDLTTKIPLPTPTTYEAALRHYLEICAPVSRQFVATLAAFSPGESSKAVMDRLGSDKEEFRRTVTDRCLNIAMTLESICSSQPWSAIPFSAMIEGLSTLQPRYYSISSSSLVQKERISITAVVGSVQVTSRTELLKGITTNYLLALKQRQNGDSSLLHGTSYLLDGPRKKYSNYHVPVHVRQSNFKLPSDISRPVIMIGPGTGVAPFRAFVQERAKQAKAGEKIGKLILFYGCRKPNEDFLYQKEWEEYKAILGENFELITALSRDGPTKVYVQHKLAEHAVEVEELLSKKGYFYVCGDAARMARDVHEQLIRIIAERRALSEQEATDIVASMRSSNQYQEDVWS